MKPVFSRPVPTGRYPPTRTPAPGAEGAMVFARRGCSTCHGPTGEEGPSIALVGGDITTRTNYWPFAPSIWDYIRRVMPYDRPGILTDDDTYAVTRTSSIATGSLTRKTSWTRRPCRRSGCRAATIT